MPESDFVTASGSWSRVTLSGPSAPGSRDVFPASYPACYRALALGDFSVPESDYVTASGS